MDAAKKATDYVKESFNSATSETSKEANKNVAKDRNNPVTTRASAAKDAVGDKMSKETSEAKAEANKPVGSSNQ
ncbi:hypothetical protein VUR80DRAFT_7208 [Thermomyces stellatus]